MQPQKAKGTDAEGSSEKTESKGKGKKKETEDKENETQEVPLVDELRPHFRDLMVCVCDALYRLIV